MIRLPHRTDTRFPAIGDHCQYLLVRCPKCGEEWMADFGFSGAISRGPECLQASQHYEWDDDDG